jgi:segregation and condensation protein B
MASEKTNQSESGKELDLAAQVEALLFVAPTAVPSSQIATALGVTTREVDQAIQELNAAYTERGIRIQEHHGRLQMTSAPEAAAGIERLLELDTTSSLTRASLETLAIIVYQQPVTRPQIDAIRGVNSDSVIRNLLIKGMIEEVGRTEGPGRPILYTTSPDFLQYFGLSSLSELPPLQLPETLQFDEEGNSLQPELPLHDNNLRG